MLLQGNFAHRVISCPSSFVRVQNSMCQFTFCGKFRNLISKINYFWQQLVFSFTILLFENQLTMSTQNFAPFHYRFIVYSAKFLVPAKLSPEPSSTLSKKENTMTRLTIPCSVFQASSTALPVGLTLTRISVLQLQLMTFLRRSIRSAFVGVKT